MNEKLYTDTLSKYKKWADNNKKEVDADIAERHAMCENMQTYTKERLENLTEEEFFSLIAPLWAMRMWGNKQYYLDNVIESNGMPLIREQLINLFYGKASIEKRWDEFREKIKGFGPSNPSLPPLNQLTPSGSFPQAYSNRTSMPTIAKEQ